MNLVTDLKPSLCAGLLLSRGFPSAAFLSAQRIHFWPLYPVRRKSTVKVLVGKWYPHPELNRNQRFRKPPLYPFELWGHTD
jgi:hypothetical protein